MVNLIPVNATIQRAYVAPDVELQVGDWIVRRDNHASMYQVTGFVTDEQGNVVQVETNADWGGGFNRFDVGEFKRREYIRLYDHPDKVLQDGLTALAQGVQLDEQQTETRALTVAASPDQVQAMRRQIQAQQDRIIVMRQMIERKLSGLNSYIQKMGVRLGYVEKVARLLETFLGVYEKIILIHDGQPAPIETPITIRQLVLSMDEEVGDTVMRFGQPGITCHSVEDFDRWLLRDGNLDRVVPEAKCVVALRPSMQDRDYGYWMIDAAMRKQNNMMYLLIRNGEQVWRVWTELGAESVLFPRTADFDKLQQRIVEAMGEEKELELKGEALRWQTNAALIQGLIERTDTLSPHPADISLFRMESIEAGQIVLIRDAEASLGDGHLPFEKWRLQQNDQIRRGTKVLISGVWMAVRHEDMKYHIRADNIFHSYPMKIEDGLYQVEAVEPVKGWNGMGEMLKILYQPQYWQRRIGWYAWRSDSYLINYETPTFEEVDYYMADRRARRGYLKMMPMLKALRDARLAERQQEADLVRLMAHRMGVDENRVWEAVEWWKTKVIYTRSITDDDHKAWRMIEKRIKNSV